MSIKFKCANGTHCDAMSDALAESVKVTGKRGLNGVDTINIKAGTMKYIGVRYCATSKQSDKGVMLNFCPFCGANIQWWSVD